MTHDVSISVLTTVLGAPLPLWALWVGTLGWTVSLAMKARANPAPLSLLALLSLLLIAASFVLSPLSAPIMSADPLALVRRWMLVGGLGGTLILTAIGAVMFLAALGTAGLIGIGMGLIKAVERIRLIFGSMAAELNEAREEGRRKRDGKL